MREKSNKVFAQSSNKRTTMSDHKKNTPDAGGVAYPDKTTGSEAAASVRKNANDWSEETRAKFFEKGMQIIYGGSSSASAKIRS